MNWSYQLSFKGAHSVKRIVRGKPNPWGFKLFILCGQSGLVYSLILYQENMIEVSDELKKIFGLDVLSEYIKSKLLFDDGHFVYVI